MPENLYFYTGILTNYAQPVHQGSTINELRAYARKQSTYWKYGTSSPSETLLAKLSESAQASGQWVLEQLNIGANAAQKKAEDAKAKAKEEL